MLTPIYLLQDNARDLLAEDHLGMKPWVDVIAGSALGNDGPFTIGIYKEWGYGKTTLLQLAQQTIADFTKNPANPVVTVWFNAWQFEREKEPLFPLLAAIARQLEAHSNADKSRMDAEQGVKGVKNVVKALIAMLSAVKAGGKLSVVPGMLEVSG